MKTFSVLMIAITFVIGVIVVMPAPAERVGISPFVKKSICDLRTEFESKLNECESAECEEEWQTKLDLLSEEEGQ